MNIRQCAVPENIHIPNGGHFFFSPFLSPPPPFSGISIPGGTCQNPHPWNVGTFPTWLGFSWNEELRQKLLLRYTIMRKSIVSAIKREKNPLSMLVQCLIISISLVND